MTTPPSPAAYADALGGRIDQLHPRLRRYFATLPAGAVGIGEGIFERVGTSRPALRILLRPLFLLLQHPGAVLAGWAEQVPFTVRNHSVAGQVCAERTFRLPGRTWVMRDTVRALPGGRIVDSLGDPPTLAAVFDVTVQHGALLLRSTRLGLQVGRLRLRVPRILTPRIRLTESFDDTQDRQRVVLTVELPLLGRIYEYAGTFRYEIQEDAA